MTNNQQVISHLNSFSNENEVRDYIFNIIKNYYNANEIIDSTKKSRSEFCLNGQKYILLKEGRLSYQLPNIKLDHKSDIQIERVDKNKNISIEIKFRSAVTDQFKCRAFDMFHLKNNHKEKLYGILIYVKSNVGIKIERARLISYPYDCFLGINENEFSNKDSLNELLIKIDSFIKEV